MPTEVYSRSSHQEIKDHIWALISGLAGHNVAYKGLVDGIKARVGLTALYLFSEAYREKSEHGTDAQGIHWANLSPETIAARALGQGDVAMGIKRRGGVMGKRAPSYDILGRPMRPFLSEAENKRWKFLFKTRVAYLRGKFGMDDESAAAQAAAIAWNTLKAEGAQTKLKVLGTRDVVIGVNTGRLAASLSPGTEDPKSHPLDAEPPPPLMVAASEPGDRILKLGDPGIVIVGSNVVYASRFHDKRKLWNADGSLPDAWNQELAGVCRRGVLEAIVLVVQGQG